MVNGSLGRSQGIVGHQLLHGTSDNRYAGKQELKNVVITSRVQLSLIYLVVISLSVISKN